MSPTAIDPRRAGLTVLEVLLALAVLAILGATFTTAVVGNLRHTTVSGQRTQSAQVLNYLGRRVAGGDEAVLPAVGESLAWDYGELGTAFADLQGGDGFAEPGRYRAEIVASGTVTTVGATVVQYDLSVCFRNQEAESCTRGTTLGAPALAGSGTTPPLPGIN
ncbi:MAG TPA: hypothetical protein VFD39_10550 [Trueperaceae bacterium]|nr:hypothetical protein [Trueperaceae bacterium]